MHKRHWLLLAALAGGGLTASDFPESVLPQGVGVNIHFTRGHEKDLDMIREAGFKFVRMDFTWGGIERKKGEYDWAAYEELTANLEKRGLRALYILDYSNSLYEDTISERDSHTGKTNRATASPQKPESVAAFARWAGAAAAHFKGRRIIWEIWNEPNIGFWKPKPDVRQYITLAQATCKAVRAADPNATIIAPASSGFPWPFFEDMFKAGLLEHLDAVSVHPYRSYSRPPETALEDYLRLRVLIERYAPPQKKRMPILSGEWGYATHDKGVSLETQAQFIVRQQLANLLHGVPLSIWYDWKNDGADPAYNEHNFGTVTQDLKPKPSYEALRVMTRELDGCRLIRRLDAGHPNQYVVLFVNAAGNQKLAAWTIEGAAEATVNIGLDDATQVAIADGRGQPLPARLERGSLRLALSGLPQYVTLKKPSPKLAALAAWRFSETPLVGVRAGDPAGLQIKLAVQNPFPQNVTARASLSGASLAGTPTQTARVAAGRGGELALATGLTRRDQAMVAPVLRLELMDEADRVSLGSTTETLHFRLSNPLALTIAPVAHGLRVFLAKEDAAPFAGLLQIGAQKKNVRLAAGEDLAQVDLGLETGAPVRLLDEAGALVAEAPLPRFQSLPEAGFRARLDGDAKVPAEAKITTAAPPAGASPFPKVFALDYRFADGWRFVRCEADWPKAYKFETRPAALGLWIYGDKSGNALRMRVQDESGQTFQPGGPNLDWQGWRWVEFDLADFKKAGHWGGANDGVAKGSLRLDTVLLVDGSRRQTSGKIYFAGPALVYR